MKKLSSTTFLFLLSSILYTPIVWAQGLDVDIDLTNDSPKIFENTYFWIGVAIVAIIAAFVIRGKKK